MESGLFLVFFHLDDLLAVIIAAMLADPVGHLHLVALGAFHDAGKGQFPIGPAAVLARFGSSILGKSHDYTSSSFLSICSASKGCFACISFRHVH
jgi:hypothetical protein